MLKQLPGPSRENQFQQISYHTSGGMARIYTAVDEATGKQIAIKVIQILSPEDRDLLESEFKIASTLDHPNILRSFYYNSFTDDTGEYFYSVNEFCSGGSLREFLKQQPDYVPVPDCMAMFSQFLHGLEAANHLIVHRDLKPENILLGDDGNWKITDFGISKFVNRHTRSKTHKGAGTYEYMSPESWENQRNTKAMDIYSMGILFFEVLALQRPFDGPTRQDYEKQHRFDLLPPIERRNDIPPGLTSILKKMTAKRPQERFEDAGEILLAFEKMAAPTANEKIKIQTVLKNINRKQDVATAAALQKEQEQRAFDLQQQQLNFSISSLFNQFIEVAEAINYSSLAPAPVNYKTMIVPTNAAASTFKLHFSDHSLTIGFYASDLISMEIKANRQRQLDDQKQRLGMVFNEPVDGFLVSDQILFIGKVETSVSGEDKRYGFNLLLRKRSTDDMYGEWWMAGFHKTLGNFREFYHRIEPHEFFDSFEDCRRRVLSGLHMQYQKVNEELISQVFEKMSS